MNQDRLRARAISLDGKITTIKLESEIWSAVEEVAKEQGKTWRQWVEHELAQMPPQRMPRAGWIRTRVMTAYDEMLMRLSTRAFHSGRDVSAWEEIEHPLASGFHCVDEATFSETIKEPGVEITYSADCKGFILHLGYRDGVPAIFIENEMRGGLNPIFLIEKE